MTANGRSGADQSGSAPRGPGSPYYCLLDEQEPAGIDLPAAWHALYGHWYLRTIAGAPYTYVNFVTSRDGRVSFNEPGKSSGGPVSRSYRHDLWMMGLLRARADAVLVGGSMMSGARRHAWTGAAVFPEDRLAWEALRAAEGRGAMPLHVVVTRSGVVDAEAAAMRDPAAPVLVVTTSRGVEQARRTAGSVPNVDVLNMGEEIDFRQLQRLLAEQHGIRTLLSEAGPQVYGALTAAGAVHDEFLTLSPILVGSSGTRPRPSLIEGTTFMPNTPPQSRLLGVRRSGDYLFLHSRYR